MLEFDSNVRPTQVVWSPKGVGNANFRDSEALLFGAVPLVDETSVACMSELYTAQNQVEGGTKHVPPCIRMQWRAFRTPTQGGYTGLSIS